MKYLKLTKTCHLNYNIPGEFYAITAFDCPFLILVKTFSRTFLKNVVAIKSFLVASDVIRINIFKGNNA